MSSNLQWLSVCCLTLAGCASSVLTSYDQSLTPLLQRVAQGDAAGAATTFAARQPSRPDSLYLLEQGELQRTAGQFDLSVQTWVEAERLIRLQDAPAEAKAWLERSSQYLLNDKARPYVAHDFERVLMSSRQALNLIALGRWNEARVEIRRSHEMEARIAEQQAIRQQKLLAEQGERALPGWDQIGGYPVEVIDAPEVRALKNSYQSAFSHYLAGFVYEALGENSLAAAGYRQAIELQGTLPVLDDGLRELDRRASKNDGLVDTLIVVEAGWAPQRQAQNFTLPLPWMTPRGYVSQRLASISFPLLRIEPQPEPAGWRLGDKDLDLDLASDTSLMARRALRDEMPMIMLRTSARAISRWAVSSSLERHEGNSGVALALASGLLQLGGAVVEQADDRCWRSLPGRFYLTRLRLVPGSHQLAAPGVAPLTLEVNAGAKQQLVVLRWLDHHLTRVQ